MNKIPSEPNLPQVSFDRAYLDRLNYKLHELYREIAKSINNNGTLMSEISVYAAKGEKGYSRLAGFGQRENLTSGALVDLWQGTADVIPLPPDAGEQMQIVSTSAGDAAAGVGARKVHIHYLDANGNESFEIVTMNGVMPVLTTATNIRFVQSMHTHEAGANKITSGTITISKAGAPATVYNQINAGGNMSLTGQIMVPANKTFYMTSWDCSSTDNTPTSIRLRGTSHLGVLLPGIFLFHDSVYLESSVLFNAFPVPLKFPALSIVKVSAIASIAGAKASCSFEGWIE